jgi:predicted phosphate transport protein (TIGR00153 family)
MGFKEWIVPQDKVFFSLLEKESGIVMEASRLLLEVVNNPVDFEENVDKIRRLEKQCDEVVEEIFYKLNRTFITPIDHEDISTLSTTYDDVLDHMEGIAVRMRMFKTIQPSDIVKRFVAIIVEAVEEIDSAIRQMRKVSHRQIRDSLEKIHVLENKSDDLYDRAIPALFEENDVKKILIMKDIYEQLEEIADKCQDVALVIQDIVIKNA